MGEKISVEVCRKTDKKQRENGGELLLFYGEIEFGLFALIWFIWEWWIPSYTLPIISFTHPFIVGYMLQSAANDYLLEGMTHEIYLANPDGFTEAGRRMVQEIILPKLVDSGIAVYEPFREFFHRATRQFGNFDLSRREICMYGAESNAKAIQKSILVLAILDGVDVDSGTASEIGYASALGKRVIGIRTDLRGNSADGSAVKVNLQVEWFIEMSGGQVYSTYNEGIAAAVEYVRHYWRE